MATPKLQVGRALTVIPSAFCDVPFPFVSVDSTITSVSGGNTRIQDTSTDVKTYVKTGDIVYFPSVNEAFTVQSIYSSDTFVLNAATTAIAGDDYVVYQGGQHNGCVVHVSDACDIDFVTIGGDIITLTVQPGFLPIQLMRVIAVSAGTVTAFW